MFGTQNGTSFSGGGIRSCPPPHLTLRETYIYILRTDGRRPAGCLYYNRSFVKLPLKIGRCLAVMSNTFPTAEQGAAYNGDGKPPWNIGIIEEAMNHGRENDDGTSP